MAAQPPACSGFGPSKHEAKWPMTSTCGAERGSAGLNSAQFGLTRAMQPLAGARRKRDSDTGSWLA